jgi:hypothetical protein
MEGVTPHTFNAFRLLCVSCFFPTKKDTKSRLLISMPKSARKGSDSSSSSNNHSDKQDVKKETHSLGAMVFSENLPHPEHHASSQFPG